KRPGDLALAQFPELADAAVGETGTAPGEGLVHDEDLGVHVDGGGKASRTYMPLEYSLTGRSMNSPISAKASIDGMALAISARLRPMISPLRYTFSRPENSGLKPAPNSSSAAMRPRVTTPPVVGCRMPATICSSVLFPQPFGPTSPSVSPFSTVKSISRSAQKSVCRGGEPGISSRRRSDG